MPSQRAVERTANLTGNLSSVRRTEAARDGMDQQDYQDALNRASQAT